MTKRLGSYTHEYTERDLALYALGLGCGVSDLQYVYECHEAFAALPTFAVIPAHPVAMFVPLEGYIPNYDRVSWAVLAQRPRVRAKQHSMHDAGWSAWTEQQEFAG
jgi:hypothetical protein